MKMDYLFYMIWGSLFIDDICGFIGAHIKIDKGIINNGNESNCSYQK